RAGEAKAAALRMRPGGTPTARRGGAADEAHDGWPLAHAPVAGYHGPPSPCPQRPGPCHPTRLPRRSARPTPPTLTRPTAPGPRTTRPAAARVPTGAWT